MAKGNELTIQAPRTGIAQSAHIGFEDVRNLDIDVIPGIAQLNTIMAKKSSTTVDAQIKWFARDPVTIANIFAVDSNGSVYNSSDSGATWAELSDRGGSGQGLIVWKDYLFVCEDTTIDVYGPLSGSPAWTDNWKTIDSDTDWHPMLISKNDGMVYGGAGRFVFSISENSGQTFAPGTAGTYTFTQQALDLPSPYKIKCIEELGNNLMLGTWQGTNIYDKRVADIFPWDRSSVSFGQPITMAEYGVHALYNAGNYLIVLAGIEGTVFKSDGVNAYPIARLPQNLSGGKYLEWYPGSICSFKNKIFIGVGNGGSTAIDGIGVYSIQQTGSGNILNLEHTISTLNDGTSNPLKISALLPVSRDTLLVGWRDNATYGIDLSSSTSYAYTTDYSGYFDSPLYVVGSIKATRTFESIEFQLGKSLATGEGIKISYRTNLTDSFTTIGTYTFSNLGAIISHFDAANIPLCEMLQIRVALLGTSTTTPQFKSLTIR